MDEDGLKPMKDTHKQDSMISVVIQYQNVLQVPAPEPDPDPGTNPQNPAAEIRALPETRHTLVMLLTGRRPGPCPLLALNSATGWLPTHVLHTIANAQQQPGLLWLGRSSAA